MAAKVFYQFEMTSLEVRDPDQGNEVSGCRTADALRKTLNNWISSEK